MVRSGLLLILACLSPTAWSANAQNADTLSLNLNSAISVALDVSPEIGAERSGRDFARARLGLARSSRFLTELSLTTAHAPVPGLTNPNDSPEDQLYLDPDVKNDFDKLRIFNRLELELLQPLHTWGEISGNVRAAQFGVGLEDAEVRLKSKEVALRTGELYYNFLLASELERIVAEAGSLVQQAKQEISTMIEEGNSDVDDADLFQVLITEQEYNRRVIEVREKLETARTALSRQLRLNENIVLSIDAQSLSPLMFARDSLRVYQELALRHRPEMSQAAAGIAARSALVDVARSDLYPKLFLGARFSIRSAPGRHRQAGPFHSDPFAGQSLEAGIGVRQKLNFFQTKAKVKQAEAELDEVNYQLEAVQQLILFEVENAYRDLIIASSAMESQNEALRISREWLQLESINFDLDLGDTENLVKAVRANLELQATAQQTVSDYNIAVLKLFDACGLLVDQIASGTLVE